MSGLPERRIQRPVQCKNSNDLLQWNGFIDAAMTNGREIRHRND